MKIIIIGATGTIGQFVTTAFKNDGHEVITVGHTRGDYQLDIMDEAAIIDFYQKIGPFDALASTNGKVAFKPFDALSTADWHYGLNNKLMGQVNLVRHGIEHINDGGSFSLISGLLSHDPVPGGASSAMVNGALEGFVRATAMQLPRRIRLNLISPALLTESQPALDAYFKGHDTVDGIKVGNAYLKSACGLLNGEIMKVGW